MINSDGEKTWGHEPDTADALELAPRAVVLPSSRSTAPGARTPAPTLAEAEHTALEHTGLDHTVSAATAAAIERGVADNTLAAHTRDWTAFTRWCSGAGRTPLPATAATLAEYTTHLAYTRHLAPSTVSQALSSIRVRHAGAGLEAPDRTAANRILTGYRDHLARTGDPKARPRRAVAATPDDLPAMLATLDRATPTGQRDAALMLLAFRVAAREAELVAVNIEHVTRHPRGLSVRLYRSKTRQLQDHALKPSKGEENLCAVRALTTWMATLAEHGRTRGPLFIRIDQHQNLGVTMSRGGRPIGDPDGRLSVRAVDPIIAGAAKRAGLTADRIEGLRRQWSGHSLRRGYASAARAAGVDPITIARRGGWKENSTVLWGYFEEDVDRWAESAEDDLL
ncbi:MAG: tyrosine-type recombinase/integrase, partial [Nonomuraea sp.]|nr:tyrosine-type recombinase/integrase [Nonomuraea sp.]